MQQVARHGPSVLEEQQMLARLVAVHMRAEAAQHEHLIQERELMRLAELRHQVMTPACAILPR